MTAMQQCMHGLHVWMICLFHLSELAQEGELCQGLATLAGMTDRNKQHVLDEHIMDSLHLQSIPMHPCISHLLHRWSCVVCGVG